MEDLRKDLFEQIKISAKCVVEEVCKSSAELASDANKGKRCAITIMVGPFSIVLLAFVPHSLEIRVGLLGLVKTGKDDRDGEEHKHLVLEILLELRLVYACEIAGDKALSAYGNLMAIALD